MNELSLTIIRVAFLAVLWLFVIAAIGVVRTDLLGGPSTTARRGKARQAQAPRPARPPRAGRGSPRTLVVTAGALKGTSLDLTQQVTAGWLGIELGHGGDGDRAGHLARGVAAHPVRHREQARARVRRVLVSFAEEADVRTYQIGRAHV